MDGSKVFVLVMDWMSFISCKLRRNGLFISLRWKAII